MKILSILVIAVNLIALVSCTKDIGANPDFIPKPSGACDSVTFTKHIAPIFTNQCAICHFTGGQSPELIDYTTIKTQADGGRIKARVLDQLPSPMPQGGSLTQPELALVKCWLDAGAPNN